MDRVKARPVGSVFLCRAAIAENFRENNCLLSEKMVFFTIVTRSIG